MKLSLLENWLESWREERAWYQEDNEHRLIGECFKTRRNDNDTLIDSAKGLGTINLMHAWFYDESDLTENQKELNKNLLNILSGSPDTGGRSSSYSTKVDTFLDRNENNKDLETVFNLKRGESGLTVLHAVVSMAAEDVDKRVATEYVLAAHSLIKAGANPNVQNDSGQTPLHYAAIGLGDDDIVNLIEAGADPNVQDIEGKTPLHYVAEVEDLLLKAGATDLEERDYNREKCLPKSRVLWDDLTPDQKKKRDEFFVKVNQAQDMKQLEEVVDQAIRSGVRLNFICPEKVAHQDEGNFTDCVMKKISALKESSEIANDIEVASGIIYKLVSKGAVLHNLDRLGSGFEGHKTNMKRAHENYMNNALKFMKIVKNAATGRVKNAKMDNSTFYLEYSKNSKIDVAKITDGARDLGLTQGEIEYGRNIIKIGKSEVEIITQKGIRCYTDLADGSDIVLTFSTNLGELEVNLSPDKEDKDKIIVEVNDQGLLERLKNCNEKIGQNCSFGGSSVNKAIEQGFFIRSGKLCQPPETMSSSVQQSHGYELKSAQPIKQQLLQDLYNVESNVTKKEKDFDAKTHLIDIFKILHKLLRDKENVSKTDLANVAEKESRRLGLEGRYNWNGIFGLEKAVSQNIEQEGSSLPLSSDLYRQDKLVSSVSNKVEKCTTKGKVPCSNLLSCNAEEAKFNQRQSPQQALTV